MSRKKLFIGALVVILLIGVSAYAYHKREKAVSQAHVSKPVLVRTEQVKTQNLPMEFYTVGSLAPVKSANITSEVPGVVSKITFVDGAHVAKGKLLIQLDDSIKKAEVASARAIAAFSKQKYNRDVTLSKRGAVSKEALEAAEVEMARNQNAVKVREEELLKTQLRAPFAGRVGEAQVSEGDYVGIGQPLVRLTALAQVKVKYAIPEKYLGYLAEGQPVSVTTMAFPGKTFHGEISYIAPTVSEADRSVAVYAIIENTQNQLLPGLSVSVVQTMGNHENVLTIPETALVATLEGATVFVVEGDSVKQTLLQLGAHVRGRAEVLSGLGAQSVVVTDGHQRLKDGSKITTSKEQSLS